MATNHTENYGLSQWEADDYVMREDFNSDNAIIDAAINTVAQQISTAGKMKQLYTHTQTGSGMLLTYNLSEIDFTPYKVIIADIDASSDGNSDITFNFNNIANCGYSAWGSSEFTDGWCGTLCKSETGANRIVMFSPFGGEYPISLLNFSTDGQCQLGKTSVTFATLMTLILRVASPLERIASGAKVTLWGIE